MNSVLKLDAFSYSQIIDFYLKESHINEAIEVLEEMVASGTFPDSYIYRRFMIYAEFSKDRSLALYIWGLMQKYRSLIGKSIAPRFFRTLIESKETPENVFRYLREAIETVELDKNTSEQIRCYIKENASLLEEFEALVSGRNFINKFNKI